MDWLRRIGRPSRPGDALDETPGERVERTSPGLAAFLDPVSEDRTHAILDLGPASESSLRVYSRFARWVRFADLSATAGAPGGSADGIAALPAQPEHPYDLIFAWDVLDRLDPDDRPKLVRKLAEVSSVNARLYVVVGASSHSFSRPLRFALLDVDRMRYEPTGTPEPPQPHLLPAEVERVLRPFKVERAFTAKVGLREYVAVRSR